jgi:hypothetical protein
MLKDGTSQLLFKIGDSLFVGITIAICHLLLQQVDLSLQLVNLMLCFLSELVLSRHCSTSDKKKDRAD